MSGPVNVSHLATDDWQHAMITGDGRQGVLCYGTPAALHLTLAHERLFLPIDEPLDPPDTGAILSDLRELCHAGRFADAAGAVVARAVAGDGRYANLRQADPFVGAGTLTIALDATDTPTGWRREVDFASGVVRQAWDGVAQEVFVSRPHSVVVVRLRGTALTGRLTLSPIDGEPPVPVAFTRPVGLGLEARFGRRWQGAVTGYRIDCRVRASGGRTSTADGTLLLHGVDEVVLLLRTTVDGPPAAIADLPVDFDALLTEHVRVHGELFGRCRLALGPEPAGSADRGSDPSDPTEKLLSAGPGPALVQRLFDAGRYAVISASGELPPNLQGVWSGTYHPAWRGGYTLDGNLPAVLAAAGPTGTPELLLPLFDLLDAFQDDFRGNADRLYRARGVLLPPHLTTHGRHNHFSHQWCLTFWTGAAAWMARLYVEYWRYTGDEHFLRTRALPFLREAVQFYAEFLTGGWAGEERMEFLDERDGWLGGGGGNGVPYGRLCLAPSYSPENSPTGENASQASVNATMEVAAVRGLLRDLAAFDGDRRWSVLLERLPPYAVDADGTLAEWLWPGLASNHAHRHASHLFGLWYDPDPELVDDPALRAAAIATVRARLAWWREHGDEMAYGLVQLGLAAAALDLTDEAHETIQLLATRYWRPSLVPTHNIDKVMNVDICGGLPAVVVAMLVRGRGGRVDLLPAAPDEWATGEIRGVLLRDGLTVRSLAWSARQVSVELVSRRPRQLVVSAPDYARSRIEQRLVLDADRVVAASFPRQDR